MSWQIVRLSLGIAMIAGAQSNQSAPESLLYYSGVRQAGQVLA